MKRINLLDIETSNKIAAGEVVERPFSVVKELVENSIDAGADTITVEIEDGGQKNIKIIDNGIGIHPEDIETAFMPHATSKISSVDDIYNISTMGFRGEALASIASISKVNLKSRTCEIDYGKEISIKGGILEYIKDSACNVGTTIEVKDIFFNVPARQKFLKSSSRESAYISDIINRLALAHSNISFKFLSNGRKSLTTYGTSKLSDAIRSVYGKTISDNITSFEKHTDIVSVHGYIGNSEISRGSRNNQSVFVNKRYIKSKLITAAVENAFKSFLTVNKYPFFVVFLDIFPEFIDVNVHPTKSEIKFRDDRQIFKLVFDAVHEALRESLRDSFNIEQIYGEEKETVKEDVFQSHQSIEKIQLPIDLNSLENNYKNMENVNNNYSREENPKYEQINETLKTYNNLNINSSDFVKENIEIKDKVKEITTNEALNLNEEVTNTKDANSSQVACEIKKEKEQEYVNNPNPKFPFLNLIGQFNSTYILAEAFDTLYLIDQHAAHEKILFEKYQNSIKKHTVIAQILMTPVVIELTAEEYSYYEENIETFSKCGFSIEPFGDNTIFIREVPMFLGKPDVKNLFMDILNNLKNMGCGETWEVKYNSIAKLACKSAIKANDSLSNIEMKALIEELRFIEDPFTCPHGRPTIIKFTLNELEKKFKRIQ